MPIIRAERHRLRNWLATDMPIQWGRRVARIEYDNDEVSVYFEDGTSAKGDILVGADGINSVGRSLLDLLLLHLLLLLLLSIFCYLGLLRGMY